MPIGSFFFGTGYDRRRGEEGTADGVGYRPPPPFPLEGGKGRERTGSFFSDGEQDHCNNTQVVSHRRSLPWRNAARTQRHAHESITTVSKTLPSALLEMPANSKRRSLILSSFYASNPPVSLHTDDNTHKPNSFRYITIYVGKEYLCTIPPDTSV